MRNIVHTYPRSIAALLVLTTLILILQIVELRGG